MSNTSLASLKEEFNAEQEAEDRRAARDPGTLPAFLLLLMLIAFHIAANLWWLHADNHVIRTDEEGHMLLARTYHEEMFVKDYPDPVRRIIAVSQIPPGIPAHPPLFHLLGAGMVALFGYNTDVIAATSTVLFAILLLGCYLLARTFLRPWQSLFVVFVVSLTPVVFAASRFFMTDYASAAIVAWAILALIKSNGFQRPGWVLLFAVLNGLGILARTVTFAYLLAPAIAVVLLGLYRVVRNKPNDFERGTYTGLTVNVLMALTVSAGIFGPWYVTHLEPFYDYWSNKEINGSRGPLTNFAPPVTVTPSQAAPAVAVAAPPVTPQPAYQQLLHNIGSKLKQPPVAWIRYPVYVVNNGLFLPLAACALLGMLVAVAPRQFRTRTVLLLFLWVLGSWFFFSVCIRSGTPRYAVPVAPALGIFAALAVLALPGRWIQAGAGGVLAVLLLFQYGNLTFHTYTPFPRAEVPLSFPPVEARHFLEKGLVVYKDHLTLGFSYSRLGPPVEENFKERLIQAMLAHEKTLPVREGRYANYQKLNLRGMELHDRHFWPGDNPYRLPSLAPEEVPERQLQMIHMGIKPKHLLPKLDETDYILYQVDAANPQLAESYVSFFQERGFDPIESFNVPGYGWVPPTINGVLARRVTGDLVPVSAPSIVAMDLYDLVELKESADFQRLPPDLRALARQTLEKKVGDVATPYQLNEAATFMTADVARTDEGIYRFRLLFKVEQAMEQDWRMFFHGYVEEENVGSLPPEKQAQGYVDWNFDPRPPTTAWAAGDYIVLTHQIETQPMVYQFTFGFFRENTLSGRPGYLKTMDLALIP